MGAKRSTQDETVPAGRVEEVLRDQRYLVQRLARSGPVAATSGRASGAVPAPGAGTATPGSVRPLSMAGTAATGAARRLGQDVSSVVLQSGGMSPRHRYKIAPETFPVLKLPSIQGNSNAL